VNSIKAFVLATFSLFLSACVGVSSFVEVDVDKERNLEYERAGKQFVYIGASKNDIMARQGAPDSYELFSNENTWVYEYGMNGSWCGIMPFLIIPVPLLLPVCNEGDVKFTFENDVVIKATVTDVVESDFICTPLFFLLDGSLCSH
jgi:hypothetical protein